MNDDLRIPIRTLLERDITRLTEELRVATDSVKEIAAKLEIVNRDIEDHDRLAAKYGAHVESSKTPKQVPGAAVSEVSPPPNVPSHGGPAIETINDLVGLYRTSERSTYKSRRFKTREYYDNLIKPIQDTAGTVKIAGLKTVDIQRLYDGWTDRGTKKLSMAHSQITMLRMLANFGRKAFGDPACDDLSVILHRMRFATPKSRNERLTKEHVLKIIEKAHETNLASIALAQAFQFDCGLRQKDVVGEWVPESEPGDSDVRYANTKWLHGIRWEEIDANLTLHHVTSKEGNLIERPLARTPLLSKELARLGELPKHGPVIVSEKSGRPWFQVEFRRNWRMIANACEIPKSFKNRDSRIDAVNEANNLKGDDDSDEPKLRLVK